MRAVIQRVTAASVSVDGLVAGACGAGLLVLLGVAEGDEVADADRLAGKVARLRLFENDDGKFDRALLDTGGEALVVSQFTLIADYKSQGTTARPGLVPGWKGNRPSFTGAARPEVAEPLFDRFVEALRAEDVPVQTGVFGARMQVELVNDGPVTIILDV
jgi:D-tyrosyl-tRNA(Tyr) deacylase